MASKKENCALTLVVAASTLIAAASIRPYAGSWNDGSRLAAVECLVDYGTLAIDNSIFVVMPGTGRALAESPSKGRALENGTLDKLYIDGHYYSDKSPVPALILAVFYQVLQWLTGLQARADPGWFCWWMTLLSSGFGYVAAVFCVHQFGRRVGLSVGWQLLFTASFGLATVSVVYVQHVNNHAMLLGVAAVLFLQAARLADAAPPLRLILLGGLGGLAYTIDLGAGPPLLVATALLASWHCRGRVWTFLCFAVAALPWLALHHAVNYVVGGTWGPANAVPQYCNWEGSPFHGTALTGSWHHQSAADFAVYSLALLFGKRGFFGHNLPLFLLLAVLGAAALRLRLPFGFPFVTSRGACSHRELGDVVKSSGPAITGQGRMSRNPCAFDWPLAALSAGWCIGTWLLYASASRNYSGACCSIRWFVPLLVPGYFCLGGVLSAWPHYRPGFLVLTAWGGVMMGIAWWQGPWTDRKVPAFWFIQAAALACWAWVAWRGAMQEVELDNLRGFRAGQAAKSFPLVFGSKSQSAHF